MLFSAVYKYISIAGFALCIAFGASYFVREYTYAAPGDGSEETPYTICASECDYTSLEDYRLAVKDSVISASPTSTYVEIREGYDAAAEPEFMGGPLTGRISCENDSVVIERPGVSTNLVLGLTTESTLSSCIFRNVYLEISVSSGVAGNTFEYTDFSRNAILLTDPMGFGATIQDVTIRANMFIISGIGEFGNNYSVINLLQGTNFSNISILENTFIVEEGVSGYTASFINGISQQINGLGILNNSFYNPNASFGFIYLMDTLGDVQVGILYNTFISDSEDAQFVILSDDTNEFTLSPTLAYNLFVNRSGDPDENVSAVSYGPIRSGYTILSNGFSGYANEPGNNYGSSGEEPLFINDDIFLTAEFQVNATETYRDDFTLVPYSNFIDAAGNTDIGNSDMSRPSSFTISNTELVDYENVHASSTRVISEGLRAGDTWTIVGGGEAYSSITLDETYDALSGVTDGPTTTFMGVNNPVLLGENISAFSLRADIKNPIFISGIEFQTEVTGGGGTPYLTYWSLDTTTTTYAGPDIGNVLLLSDCGVVDEGDTYFFINPESSFEIKESSGDIEALLADGVSIALFRIPEGEGDGLPYIFYLPKSIFPNQAAFRNSACVSDDFGGTPEDVFLDTVYSYVDGRLVFTGADVLSANGVSVTEGFPETNIIIQDSDSAGISIHDKTDVMLEHVTTTGGVYGLRISGESSDIAVTDSVFTSSTTAVQLSGELENVVFTSSVLNGDEFDMVFSGYDVPERNEVVLIDTVIDSDKVDTGSASGNVLVAYSLPRISVIDTNNDPLSNTAISLYIPFASSTAVLYTDEEGDVGYVVNVGTYTCMKNNKNVYVCNDPDVSSHSELEDDMGAVCVLDGVLDQYECVVSQDLSATPILAFIMDATTTSVRNGGFNPYIITVDAAENYVTTTVEFDLVEPNQEVEVIVTLIGEEGDDDDVDNEEVPAEPRKGGGASSFFLKKIQSISVVPSASSEEHVSQTDSILVNRGKNATASRRIPIYIPPYINADEIHIQLNTFGEKIISRRIPKNRTVWVVLPAGAGDKTLFFSLNGKESALWDEVRVVYTPNTSFVVPSKPSTSSAVDQPESSRVTLVRFLTTGMSGDDVRSLQILLQRLGFFPATTVPNGVYGPATTAAVTAFQRANGIDPFGYVGPATRSALNAL